MTFNLKCDNIIYVRLIQNKKHTTGDLTMTNLMKTIEDMVKLNFVISKKNNEGTIHHYENSFYKVFIKQTPTGWYLVDTHSDDFTMPKIEMFHSNLDVNISATGSLSKDELQTHMSKLAIASSTMTEIENLLESL